MKMSKEQRTFYEWVQAQIRATRETPEGSRASLVEMDADIAAHKVWWDSAEQRRKRRRHWVAKVVGASIVRMLPADIAKNVSRSIEWRLTKRMQELES